MDWLCLPRPDSPPVFGQLLDSEGGHFSVNLEGLSDSQQSYIPNTNILITTLTANDGSQIRITDFCPRFEQYARMYRPMAVFRIVEPARGSPVISASCQPVDGWDKRYVKPVRGNSHLRYDIRGNFLRVVTNISLTYFSEDTPFMVKEPVYFALTWGFGLEDELPKVANEFLAKTTHYWQTWVKHCSISSLYQKETIRSALALKLHCYEDTGAILAALTTSLPEENGKGRNWDYRHCWLRDAYFVLTAFHNLGHFEEMEGFLRFLLNIGHKHEHSHERLHPVYSLDQSLPSPEREHPGWTGFKGNSPVRSNNQAAEHIQNDVYGEMVLTLAPIFFDERFHHLRGRDHEELLIDLLQHCIKSISQPDAGLWELRNGWQVHSFSNLMCWAGIERIARIRALGFLKQLDVDLAGAKAHASAALEAAVKGGALRNGPKDDSLDAALLQIAILKYPDIELCKRTVDIIAEELRYKNGGTSHYFIHRYLRNDDFGTPKSAFIVCSFWLAQAYARLGNHVLAEQVMKSAVTAANHVGLLPEHFIPDENRQLGNFPQAYSHVGQINAAFAVSPPWHHFL